VTVATSHLLGFGRWAGGEEGGEYFGVFDPR
jgi:hypothetical protein